MGYDEPEILSYAIRPFCPTSADGLQSRTVFSALSATRSLDRLIVDPQWPTMSQKFSLTQSDHFVRQALTGYSPGPSSPRCQPRARLIVSSSTPNGLP